MRPVAILDSLNFWAPITIGAHGVWINADEIAVLKQRDVGISNNPESNMKLVQRHRAGPGVSEGRRQRRPRHRRRRQQQRPRHVRGHAPGGVPAEAGDDGSARRSARQRRWRWRRSAAPACSGSRQRLGSLEAGKLADVIVVGMSKPRQQPLFDPVSQIVYASRGDDVETTIVNGKVLMRERKVLTLDEAQVLQRGPQRRRTCVQEGGAVSAVVSYSSTPMKGRLRYCSA